MIFKVGKIYGKKNRKPEDNLYFCSSKGYRFNGPADVYFEEFDPKFYGPNAILDDKINYDMSRFYEEKNKNAKIYPMEMVFSEEMKKTYENITKKPYEERYNGMSDGVIIDFFASAWDFVSNDPELEDFEPIADNIDELMEKQNG